MTQTNQTIIYKYINHETDKNILYENMIKRNNNNNLFDILKKKYNYYIKSKL